MGGARVAQERAAASGECEQDGSHTSRSHLRSQSQAGIDAGITGNLIDRAAAALDRCKQATQRNAAPGRLRGSQGAEGTSWYAGPSSEVA